MQIQTRRQILEIWRATVDYSFTNGKWQWGGVSGRNSISDAEQLLSVLYPATVIDSLSVDRVDQTADDVLEYLRGLGNAMDIPRRLLEVVGDYMRTYSADGFPDFSGDTYFGVGDGETAITPEQAKLHVVDSFSMSITLCLAVLGFLRTYRQGLRSARMLAEIDTIEGLTSNRLTGAMVGLLRSFVVNTFDSDELPGRVMCAMVNQAGIANELIVRALLDALSEVRAGLRQEATIASGQVADELDNRGRMFECGWSWGVTDGAPEVPLVTDLGRQAVGVADARPYLYFTVVAMDGIQDLFTERTRVLGLLNDEQQRLARLLQVRFDLTRQFWNKVATFGGGSNWPLEDLPWTTSDGDESDYYSVLLTSIVMQGIGGDRIGNTEVERIGRLLEELANRGRITRRLMKNDPALEVHLPGMRLRMRGSEKVEAGPLLKWTVTSYSVLLLKRMLRVAELLDDSASRIRYLDEADKIWSHVEARKMTTGPGRGLWDDPSGVFPGAEMPSYDAPSWYHTERVIEVLVGAANVTLNLPTATSQLGERAEQLLAEAEYLFDRERLRGTSDTGERMRESFQVVGAKLRRARDLLRDRPGTASILAGDVLRELDTVDAARQDTARMT